MHVSPGGHIMDRPFVAENAGGELERLRSLVARMSDDELSTPLGTDWTISIALAHLAFLGLQVVGPVTQMEIERD